MWGAFSRDLQEFVSVVQSDTREALSTAIAKGGKESTEGCQEEEVTQRPNETPAAVRLLRADVKTYTEPIPSAEQQNFEDFLEDFDIKDDAIAKEVSEVLETDVTISKLYRELVPEVVSYENFWTRYFFRLSKAEKQHSSTKISLAFDLDEDPVDLGWDNDNIDEEQDNNGLSEDKPEKASVSIPSGDLGDGAQSSTNEGRDVSEAALSRKQDADEQKTAELCERIKDLEAAIAAKDQEISLLKQDKTSLTRRVAELESRDHEGKDEDEGLEGWEEWS